MARGGKKGGKRKNGNRKNNGSKNKSKIKQRKVKSRQQKKNLNINQKRGNENKNNNHKTIKNAWKNNTNLTWIPATGTENTIKITKISVNRLQNYIPELPLIENEKIKSIHQIMSMDRVSLNLVLRAWCKNLKMKNGKLLKNTSIMSTVLNVQRGINEYRRQIWERDMLAGTIDRNSTCDFYNFKADHQFQFWNSELDHSMKEAKKERGAKKSVKAIKNSTLKSMYECLDIKCPTDVQIGAIISLMARGAPRGGKEIRNQKRGNFKKSIDEDGYAYWEYTEMIPRKIIQVVLKIGNEIPKLYEYLTLNL